MDIKEQILVALGLNKDEEVKLAWQGKSEDGTILSDRLHTLRSFIDGSLAETLPPHERPYQSSYLYADDECVLSYLDQYVIGQDYAKTVLSVAVCNHYKRIIQPPIEFDLDLNIG